MTPSVLTVSKIFIKVTMPSNSIVVQTFSIVNNINTYSGEFHPRHNIQMASDWQDS